MSEKSSLPGVNILLFGPPGSGKTHALRTLVDSGLEVFCIFTEPGMEVISDVPCSSMHYHYVAPSQPDWFSMISNAEKIRDMDPGQLQKLPGVNKKQYAQFIDVLKACADYKCDRCGKSFGPIDSFGTNRAVVVDSLSGINIMLLDLAVGGKPIRTLPDWGVAIDAEEKFLNRLTLGMRSHFILIAHADRQTDQVLGGIKVLPSALGQKLPALIGRFFSDVIFTSNEGGKFTWSTSAAGFDTKARNLPIAKDLPPTFKPIIQNWLKQGGVIELTNGEAK